MTVADLFPVRPGSVAHDTAAVKGARWHAPASAKPSSLFRTSVFGSGEGRQEQVGGSFESSRDDLTLSCCYC